VTAIEDAIREANSLSPSDNIYSARGSYHLRQFLLRLSLDVQDALNQIKGGIHPGKAMQGELPFAWSTYMHETIHWWQHVGTTSGLISSLAYPAQAHLNHRRLKQSLEDVGPKKSIMEVVRQSASHSEAVQRNLNVLVNNWHDIEFALRLMRVPSKAHEFVDNPLFECVAHSYQILWSAVIWLVSSVLDPHLKVLPDPRKWDSEFTRLKAEQVRNFYYGGGVYVPPVDGLEILEGQARFCQLQLLYGMSGGQHDFTDFEKWGFLKGVYRSAFEKFLLAAGAKWPKSINDPAVGAFLVACDVALNPTDAFPRDLCHPESFVLSVDPGMRFTLMAQEIARTKGALLTCVRSYSKQEYEYVAHELAGAIGCRPLHEVMPSFMEALRRAGTLDILLTEDSTAKYGLENRAVRMFVSRFLAFQIDKLDHPEFFVWPGIWSVEKKTESNLPLTKALELFERNGAFFVDTPSGEIRARLRPGIAEKDLDEAFQSFYVWNVQYDLVRQWLAVPGPFIFDYRWLSKEYSEREFHDWASGHFEHEYGVRPEVFQIL
jgi:hypothetical protein